MQGMAAWLSTSGPRRLSVGTYPATGLLCDPTSHLTSLDGWSPMWGEMLSKVGSPSPLFRSYCITGVAGGQGESCHSLNPATARHMLDAFGSAGTQQLATCQF